jgi:hypothetical protein
MASSPTLAHGGPARLEGPQNIAAIERRLSDPSFLENPDLLIASRLPNWSLGGAAGTIQLLVTWARRNPQGRLHLHADEEPDCLNQLEKLARQPFGLAGLTMADEVVNRSGDRKLRSAATRVCGSHILNEVLAPRQSLSDTRQLSFWDVDDADYAAAPPVRNVGRRVFLPQVDQHASWRLPQFYLPSGRLRDPGDYGALMRSMVDRVTAMYEDSPLNRDEERQLGEILYELFTNTDEWARTDGRGMPFVRSIRGILLEYHTWSIEELFRITRESAALEAYARELQGAYGGERKRFLEFSMFDSGIGLARRWMRTTDISHVPLEEEYAACCECIRKHRTTSTLPHKGFGLDKVLQLLSALKGFVRLRTGRLALYRDCIARPYESDGTAEPYPLHDWSRTSQVVCEMADVAGTLYTILIPIRAIKS